MYKEEENRLRLLYDAMYKLKCCSPEYYNYLDRMEDCLKDDIPTDVCFRYKRPPMTKDEATVFHTKVNDIAREFYSLRRKIEGEKKKGAKVHEFGTRLILEYPITANRPLLYPVGTK